MKRAASITCRIKGYIQPFERLLALEELRALTSGRVTPVGGSTATASTFAVDSGSDPRMLRTQLAYWHSVGTDPEELTVQLRAEATSVIARNGVALGDLATSVAALVPHRLPNKRMLRYATHGLHEYRGKFFPQLVRALMNMANVPRDGIVLDPMCGSGTTLVEARLSGRKAYGLDVNPLSVFVAEVKCQVLGVNPTELVGGYEAVARKLSKPQNTTNTIGYFASLPIEDQDYLLRWFDRSTLGELDSIQRAIETLPAIAIRNFFTVCLSNILRGVSWQKNDDLRVRKDVTVLTGGEVTKRFLTEAMRSTKIVAAFVADRGTRGLGRYAVIEQDARNATAALPLLRGKVDAIITSPPYATALPYLDTDRLSLVYLGLLGRADHKHRDAVMIGNREITERRRLEYWTHYQKHKEDLPKSTLALVDRIERLNQSGEVGFRRRNLAALLSKYFFDMTEVIGQQRSLLKRGGVMFMVVGNNRTTAGGEDVEIATTDHLAKIAEDLGFKVAGRLPMEMLASRDIFRKNAMASEEIITLEKQ